MRGYTREARNCSAFARPRYRIRSKVRGWRRMVQIAWSNSLGCRTSEKIDAGLEAVSRAEGLADHEVPGRKCRQTRFSNVG